MGSKLLKIPAKLYLCATPIGNLGDITLRVLDTLKTVDVIYSEDTRVTRKLLAHFDIHTSLKRCDENNLLAVWPEIARALEAGQAVAYTTDAGMPGISDPGLRLVELAQGEELQYEVLPGASAVDTAILNVGWVNSGTNFYFGGFLPRKSGKLTACLQALQSLKCTLVFYESPHRVLKSLPVIAELYPTAKVALCRELTKLHEEVLNYTASEIISLLEERLSQGRQLKGECVLLIDNT